MVIIRNGKEIELTWDEVSDAHKEFVTSWMSGVAISDFDVDIYTSRHFTHSFNMHIHQSTLDLHFIHCFSSNTAHSHNIFIADLIYVSRHFFINSAILRSLLTDILLIISTNPYIF